MNRTLADNLTAAMTVRDLIEQLQMYDEDALVVFTCDYGDYHHTQQALPVQDVEPAVARIVESAYSHSRMAFSREDHEQWFCEDCEDTVDHLAKDLTCPCCGGTDLVDEEGNSPEEVDEQQPEVIVLS